MEDWIWNRGIVGLEGLENEQKAWIKNFEFDKLKRLMSYTFLVRSD